jgi:hypothetical protein
MQAMRVVPPALCETYSDACKAPRVHRHDFFPQVRCMVTRLPRITPPAHSSRAAACPAAGRAAFRFTGFAGGFITAQF